MDWRDIGNLTTQDEVDDRADARISRLEVGLSVGTLTAPMHCSQELFDKISITDNRYDTPQTVTGIVFGILREYDRGVYRITLTLGGVEKGQTPDGGEDYKVIPRPDFPAVPGYWMLPRAIQGYHHDIHFTASDWNTVTWTGGGIIKFYDETTQSINTGSYNLPDGTLRYIYFDLADASPAVLKVTTNYVSVMTMDTGLLCLVQRALNSDMKANVIPSYGKEPLITCDFIDMTGLLEYDYGSGKKLQSILSTQISAGRVVLSEASGDLDDIDEGSTYGKLRKTDIYAGHINLVDFTIDGDSQSTVGVYIDATNGITIKGGKLRMQDSAGNHGGIIYVDTDGKLRLDAAAFTGGVYVDAITCAFNISCTSLVTSGFLYPAPRSSQPTGSDGALVYDPTDGHMKYYSAHDTQWFRIQRTGGWG